MISALSRSTLPRALIVGSPALLEGLPVAGSRAHDASGSSDGPDVAAHQPETRTNAG